MPQPAVALAIPAKKNLLFPSELSCLPPIVRPGRERMAFRALMFSAGVIDLADIGPAHIAAWVQSMIAAGQSPKTIHNHIGYVAAAYNRINRGNPYAVNPCRDADLPRVPELPPVHLQAVDLPRLFALARQHGQYVEVAVAIGTMLRLSELQRLRWTDVDFAARTILVQHRTKSDRWRLVPINKLVVEALEEQRTATGHLPQVFPGRDNHGGYPANWVYVDRVRSLGSFIERLKPIAAQFPAFQTYAAGSTCRKYHLLRHTGAMLLAYGNIGTVKLKAFLGHRDIRQTERYARRATGYDPDIEKMWPEGRTPTEKAEPESSACAVPGDGESAWRADRP